MLEELNNYAIDTVSPSTAAFTDKNLGSVERCDLTRMKQLYTKIVTVVLFDQRRGAWVKNELVGLRAEPQK